MDIHVDIRGYFELHAWICYGFSDQGFDSTSSSDVIDTYRKSCFGTTAQNTTVMIIVLIRLL